MPDRPADDNPMVLAQRAHALVESNPAQAARLAHDVAARARASGDSEAQVAALHALGFARHELGDRRAIATLRRAVRIAEHHGLSQRAAMARRPLAIYLAFAGRTRAAVDEIEAACSALDGLELARSEVSRIAVLQAAGRPPESARSERALETLRREGDSAWEARLLKNRGLMLTLRGDFEAAEPDLIRARDLYRESGARIAAIGAQYQLVRIALARGDIPESLALLDAIDADTLPPRHRSELELLRAKTLVAARLRAEARDALRVAQTIWRQAGFDDWEGRVDAITMTLLTGDAADALTLGRRTQRSFAAQGRAVYAAQAAGQSLAAAIAAGTLTASSLASGRRAAAVLAAENLRIDAWRVRLAVAHAAIGRGSARTARRELAACQPLRRYGEVADRVHAWHVEALVRLAEGDPAGAQRALLAGLRLVDDHRATLGAADLRATASELGVELARLGLRIALERNAPNVVLAWSERLRASALLLEPMTPPPEAQRRERHIELRRVQAAARRAWRSGTITHAQVSRERELETSIRRLARHTPGATGATGAAPARPHARELSRALGTNALVELIVLDGSITAVTLVDGRVARHVIGPLAPIVDKLDWLLFELNRLSRATHHREGGDANIAAVDECARSLGALLLAPIAETIEERPVVVVPSGRLHDVPWSILPQLRGRAVVVAPSALVWLRLESRSDQRQQGSVLVAGPRLRHARSELRALTDLYPEATVLAGRRATAAAVLAALDRAQIAHIACHGHFRADSPLFSALELSDGALCAYELQQLHRAPKVVVLSACDLASAETHPGEELLGFAAALLGMGSRTIIASVVPVPDAPTKRMMIKLHKRLTAGDSPAVALAQAQVSSQLSGFICIGAG